MFGFFIFSTVPHFWKDVQLRLILFWAMLSFHFGNLFFEIRRDCLFSSILRRVGVDLSATFLLFLWKTKQLPTGTEGTGTAWSLLGSCVRFCLTFKVRWESIIYFSLLNACLAEHFRVNVYRDWLCKKATGDPVNKTIDFFNNFCNFLYRENKFVTCPL